VAIEDQNLLFHLIPEFQSDFYSIAIERLKAYGAEVYGFTSMAVDSHVALELGRRLKSWNPKVKIVLGGAHFSSIADEVRARYDWVDGVVTGRGEDGFDAFLQSVGGGTSVLGQAGPLESPLYELIQYDAYRHVNPAHVINLEAGRGCKYKCAFCYSPAFQGKAVDFAVEGVIGQIANARLLGAKKVFFVGDNFLNDTKWALTLCSEIERSRLEMNWSCYVTLPDVSPVVAEAMARAGCTQVFLGLDVVGKASEQIFHKAFGRRREEGNARLLSLVKAGIRPTCGFILTPPSHPAFEDTASALAYAAQVRKVGADVVINALTLYPGTSSHELIDRPRVADSLQPTLLMDVPDFVETNAFAAEAPHLFPFHSRYVGEGEWSRFLTFCHAAHTILNSFVGLGELDYLDGDGLVQLVMKVQETIGDLRRLPAEDRRPTEQLACLKALGGGLEVFAPRGLDGLPVQPQGEKWASRAKDSGTIRR
jgi:hypothetical protein